MHSNHEGLDWDAGSQVSGGLGCWQEGVKRRFKGELEKEGDDAASLWKRNVHPTGEKMELDSVQI